MALWIEYDASLWDFWKVKRFAAKLNVPYAYGLGLVSCLWTWTARNKPDGNLSKFTDAEIADAAKWTGEVNGFVTYLKECELLDKNGTIHDWDKHGLRLLKQARARKAAFDERQRQKKDDAE